MKAPPWTRIGLLVTLLLFAVTPAIAELTQADLQAIRAIVKQEIAASEARNDLKLEKINTQIAVIKTEITAINKRLDFMQTLIIAVIASVGIMVVLATAMTYLGSKLGNIIPKIDDLVKIDLVKIDDLLKLWTDRIEDNKNNITKVEEIVTRVDAQISELHTLSTAADSSD